MKTFRVYYHYKMIGYWDVEAKSCAEAKRKAKELEFLETNEFVEAIGSSILIDSCKKVN